MLHLPPSQDVRTQNTHHSQDRAASKKKRPFVKNWIKTKVKKTTEGRSVIGKDLLGKLDLNNILRQLFKRCFFWGRGPYKNFQDTLA